MAVEVVRSVIEHVCRLNSGVAGETGLSIAEPGGECICGNGASRCGVQQQETLVGTNSGPKLDSVL